MLLLRSVAKGGAFVRSSTPCRRSNAQVLHQTARGRWKSSAVAGSSGNSDTDSSLANKKEEEPSLVRVPSLPIVGSMVQSYSKTPVSKTQENLFEFWPSMRAKYGKFYEFGLPGLGVGWKGICYIIQDPHEMASILREEGQYPRGAVEFSWSLAKYNLDRKQAVAGLLTHGPEWKRIRRFVQSDLLSPQAAANYVPGILEGAAFASKGAPHFGQDSPHGTINDYLNWASFDMFANVMMGFLPQVSNPSAPGRDPKEEEFCRNVAEAQALSTYFMLSPKERLWNMGLGIKSSAYKKFESIWEKVEETSRQKVQSLYQRRLAGQLSENEQNSYANMAYNRQASDDRNSENDKASHVSLHEVETLMASLLAAGVTTTGGYLSFKLLHLASAPEVQDRLYHELQPTLINGKLTKESLALPYLSAIMRESHRLGSAAITVPMKTLQLDRPVHGHVLPKGSVVLLDTYSEGQQQEHFPDHHPIDQFVPDRFSKEAIQQRKGTRHQVVDHSFFSGPFSQGARKCPGSRVANLEAHAMLAQWVLDWKMELPSSVGHFSDVPYTLETVTTAQLPDIQFTSRQA